MIVARMKRLSTPVALAMSIIDSWIAEVSSAVLRATSQVSQDSSMVCWLAANLENCELGFSSLSRRILTAHRKTASQPQKAILQLRCRYRCNSCKPSRRVV